MSTKGGRGTRPGSDEGGRDRALSAIVGLLLLFGLVTIGAGLIFISGLQAKDEVTQQQRIQTAENAMRQLDSEIGSAALSNDRVSVDLPESGGAKVESRPGDTTVTFYMETNDTPRQPSNRKNISTGSVPSPSSYGCAVRVTPGAVEYALPNGKKLVYEAGGIWKTTKNETRMIQPPSLTYDDGNIVFSVNNVTGGITDPGSTTAVRNLPASKRQTEAAMRQLLTGSDTQDCRQRKELVIVVTTPYHATWKKHLRKQFPVGSNATLLEKSASGDEKTLWLHVSLNALGEFDSDDDGTVDVEDNCPYNFNPDQANTDKQESGPPSDEVDEAGDVCDDDDDGDGVADFRNAAKNEESGRSVAPPSIGAHNDSDDWDAETHDYHNGFVTADYYKDYKTPADGDDMWLDFKSSEVTVPASYSPSKQKKVKDNCPQEYNPRQFDQDSDGLGDACDPDMDGDARRNKVDKCLKSYNPNDSRMYQFGVQDLPPQSEAIGHGIYEQDDDETPNACDWDDDGDTFPDYGYLHGPEDDKHRFNLTPSNYTGFGLSLSDRMRPSTQLTTHLFPKIESNSDYVGRDPAGNHDEGVGDLKSREDNCPWVPNTEQENFDKHSNDFRRPPANAPRDTEGGIRSANENFDDRGDACDLDMDDDGILNTKEWAAQTDSDGVSSTSRPSPMTSMGVEVTDEDNPCLLDKNMFPASDINSNTFPYEHPDYHGEPETTERDRQTLYGSWVSDGQVSKYFQHGQKDGGGTDEGSAPTSHDRDDYEDDDASPGSANHGPDDGIDHDHILGDIDHYVHSECHDYFNGSCVNYHYEEGNAWTFSEFKSTEGEPHPDSEWDNKDQIPERCEGNDNHFDNTNDGNRRGNKGQPGISGDHFEVTIPSWYRVRDRVFVPQPMCDRTNTPNWDDKINGTNAHKVKPMKVLTASNPHKHGCKPTEPPRTATQKRKPVPNTNVVNIVVNVVRFED